jgi:MinD superfamily P-loop ATPase
MRIAIASGKGGTGKTTIAVNLALSIQGALLVDCDVEEPNCHLFLGCDMEPVRDVTVTMPVIDEAACSLCGECASFCAFHALAVLPAQVVVFESLCHSCGGCSLVCPSAAISEHDRGIGRIERATGSQALLHGVLNVGEATATRVIAALKDTVDAQTPAAVTIFDAPPGTACPMIETVRGCDYCILVTEPTPFGLHDLRIAVEVVRVLGLPFGVVINRDGSGDDAVNEYCRREGIPVILRVPHDRQIAELYSTGQPFSLVLPGWRERFRGMLDLVGQGARA